MKLIKKRNLLLLLFSLLMTTIWSQRKTVSGKVTSQDGLPLPGVNILVQGTLTGTQTGFEGEYSISASVEQVLVFSYVGQKQETRIVDTSNIINVQMKEDAEALEEVVVVGLGQSKDPSKLAYSIATVDSEEVLKANEADIVNGLAGKTTGVQINNSSGLAGSSSRIVIRGVSSLNYNNTPLYVIDGVPISNSENLVDESDDDQALFFGSTPGESINISPDQIKNITILKGSAASAIYGSRAANGVIVIETFKGGKNRPPQISIRTATSISEIIKPELQNEYTLGIGGVYYSGEPGDQTSVSWGPKASDIGVPTYDRFDIFKPGITYDNSVSVQGGSEHSSYYTSVSMYNQEGTVPNNSFDRYSFLVNNSFDVTKKLKISTKLNYVTSENERPFEGNALTSIMWTVAGAPISYDLQPSTNPDGTQRLFRTSRNNPYYVLDNTGSDYLTNRFTPSISLSYDINDWINLKLNSGLDYTVSSSKVYENSGVLGNYNTGRILETERKGRDLNTDVIVTLNKNFSEAITADYLVGVGLFDTKDNTLFSQGSGFIIPSFYDLSNATSVLSDEYTYQKRIISAYAQANFGYNDYLFLTLTSRNDKSSTLPVKDNSFFYYSGSLGFDLAESLNTTRWMNRAMIRGSYSKVGNDAPAYATITGYSQANPSDGQRGNIAFPFRGVGSYVQNSTQGNPLLTPEFTKEYEISADLQFLNNRIGVELNYYDKKSEDQIFSVPQSSTTGFSAIYKNAGSIQNKGIEVGLNLKPIKTDNLYWDVRVNYSKNESKVLELADGVESVRLAGFTNPGIFIRKGEPYGVIWTSLYKRNDEGDLLLDDNGYPQAGSVGNAGSVTPDWTGGLSTSFNYKGFEISAVMDIRVGGNIFNLDENYTTFYGTSIKTKDREKEIILKGIKESDGTPNTTPIKKDFTYYNGYVELEEFVQKADFLKLRNVTLSYTLPSSALKALKLSNAKISLSGRNLWIDKDDSFTGSDPELSLYGSGNGQGITNFQIPSNKSYTLTFNLTF